VAGERPRMVDVARLAGVSTATVSYVLNNQPGISDERRRQVMRAIEQLGFKPNRLARGLRKGISRVLGVILGDIANPFYTDIAAGVIEASAARDYQVFVSHGGPDGELVRREAWALAEHRCDGIIFTSLTGSERELLRELLDSGVACVQAVRRVRGVRADFVGIDDRAGGRDAAAHLLLLGYRDFGVLAGPQDSSASRARFLGFLQSLREGGVQVPRPRRLECRLTRESGHAGLEELIRRSGGPPRALICGNDMIALGAIDALLERGYRVPEDVAVVGYDDMSFASARQICLTTVHQPRARIGEVAVGLLLDRLANPGLRPRTVILPHRLVVRRSCGAASLRR
jgi:LacI family transcriptional regulator